MCQYCETGGHPTSECPERLERRFGTPGDPSEAMADQTRTDGGEPPAGSDRPPLSRFDLSEITEPANGVLYLVKGRDGFWRVRNDPDIAQEEATGYPVGELVEHENLGDYDDAESGELLAIYLPWADEFAEEFTMYCPDCDGWVVENWDRVEEVWRCPICEATPIYDDKEQYVEVCHATARFNKENGYGPWYDRDEDDDPELVTDGGVPDLRSHLDDALERARQDDAELATLAFATEYVDAVRGGEKTVTLRRPGAYDVAVRHAAERDTEIVLLDDGEPFARAEIRAVWKVDAEAVAEARLAGYPDLACADDVVRILERHYELAIEGDAEHVRVHAIHFDVTELLRPAVLEGGEA